MAMDSLTLVSNPGSTSRKYALFDGTKPLATIEFEIINKKVYCSTSHQSKPELLGVSHIAFASTKLLSLLQRTIPGLEPKHVACVGLRIVAPSTYFQRDHILHQSDIQRLEKLQPVAPLHIQAILSEYRLLKRFFSDAKFMGISDSQALADKPDRAMYYAIPFKDSEHYDIKRFGYHGLSMQSAIDSLKKHNLLRQRIIVCHLGGGSSVAAVHKGRIIDSTMGFSPVEGLVMATRSGSIDVMAYQMLKKALKLDITDADEYLNNKSGLLGLSGVSDDIRILLDKEPKSVGAQRALASYVYRIQQAVGAMAAAMDGADSLVFTGTVGIRSAEMRKRICASLLHLGFSIKHQRANPDKEPVVISDHKNPASVIVVRPDEAGQIARHVKVLAG